jgi:hypothetical protein
MMPTWTSALHNVGAPCSLERLRGLLLYFYLSLQARSSVGERFLDTEEVGGSIPPVPIFYFRIFVDENAFRIIISRL